jgi:hypothetical protein
MFFTRQASSGSWVVDEHNVRHVARRQPSFDANLLWMMETSVNDPRPPDKEALSRVSGSVVEWLAVLDSGWGKLWVL